MSAPCPQCLLIATIQFALKSLLLSTVAILLLHTLLTESQPPSTGIVLTVLAVLSSYFLFPNTRTNAHVFFQLLFLLILQLFLGKVLYEGWDWRWSGGFLVLGVFGLSGGAVVGVEIKRERGRGRSRMQVWLQGELDLELETKGKGRKMRKVGCKKFDVIEDRFLVFDGVKVV
ncbi:unnamed protein product [Diplocarpon coronariae]